jgi:hypothetical protein
MAGAVNPPATCYNGIGVALMAAVPASGRRWTTAVAKPDITAPGYPAGAYEFFHALCPGAAAVLMQAGLRGDGGSDTNSAADIRTVKALLLNGAIKPADWTNRAASPLDARYGAGVLNVFNSYKQLAGRQANQPCFHQCFHRRGASPDRGDKHHRRVERLGFHHLTSSSSLDAVAHYYFNVTNGVSNATFTATATLVWNRQQTRAASTTSICFYTTRPTATSSPPAPAPWTTSSTFLCRSCRRDVTICRCSRRAEAYVSAGETYALAFEFFSLPLNAPESGTNIVLQWPIYPAGFVLQAATNLAPPVVWNTQQSGSRRDE